MEGAGVYFKASLCGKIYKHLSFLVEEDIRPRDDFKEAEWFLTTVEVNYKFNKYLLAGSGYVSSTIQGIRRVTKPILSLRYGDLFGRTFYPLCPGTFSKYL